MKTPGVLALQGDFARHAQMLTELGMNCREIRSAGDLEGIDGLVIPGGESTTIGKLLMRNGMFEPLRNLAAHGLPILGTCAGAILLASEIEGYDQPHLGLMDITVRRNAYGRQIDSFEADVLFRDGGRVHGVFIRAPVITGVRAPAEVLAEFEGLPVLVRQGRLLACTFHPELTGDARVHRLFAGLA
jgi:pyridoxal 5'-phosphate synthase pdxT subunit